MRKPKTDAPPNLLKPWPASFDGLLCAKCRGGGMDALCGACARSEVRRLRGEVRRLRRVERLHRKMLRALSAWLKLTDRDRELDLTAAKHIDAALAPRRRKKP